jgi:hypothetical protein
MIIIPKVRKRINMHPLISSATEAPILLSSQNEEVSHKLVRVWRYHHKTWKNKGENKERKTTKNKNKNRAATVRHIHLKPINDR